MPSVLRTVLAALIAATLAACSTGGLSPGLSQRMDMPGAKLNAAEALGIINHYRSSVGAAALVEDPALDASAQQLAGQYAHTGRQSPRPQGAVDVRYSAGYFTFAETFSGWRGSPADAAALANPAATRAGVAVVFDDHTPYGVYWTLILG
ncbi:MAG: CAP domain-containing protein [Devosia sp.]